MPGASIRGQLATHPRVRDDALVRVARLTRRTVAATAVALAALGVYVARAIPGHAAPSPSTGTPAARSAGTASGTTSSAGSTGIAPPTTLPARSSSPPVVSSGAS